MTNFDNLSLMPFEGCNDYHEMISAENTDKQQMGSKCALYLLWVGWGKLRHKRPLND